MGRPRRTILTITFAAAGIVGAARWSAAQVQLPPAPVAPPAPATTTPTTAPATTPATAPATTRPAVADVAGDLATLEATLLQADAKPGVREEAAARLVSRNRTEADERLRNVLMGDVPRDAKVAVARALADDPSPSESMIAPLAELMRAGAEQRSILVVDVSAQALATYRRSPDATDELIRFAGDPAFAPEARARVALALGRVVEPAAADLLIRLLRPNERATLRAAAAEALAELTGIRNFGQDVARWAQWQRNIDANARLNSDRWRADLLQVRADNLERLRRRHEALLDALDDRMFQQYQAAARQQKGSEVLLSFLESDQPDERAIAARMVTMAFRAQEPVTERVRERLVALVGDSDPQVRLDVAKTLTNLNHRPALAAELTQLAQEREERVKVALAEALGRIEDPAAAPQLAALLTDPSPRVAAAAANALSRVARDPQRIDKELVARAVRLLRGIATHRNSPVELRVAALDALAALRYGGLIEVAQNLLAVNQPDPSVTVRQAVLRGIGALGDPAGADIVTRTLRAETREPEVRRAALDALGRIGNLPEHGGLLLEYTQRQTELDEGVRQKAWESFQALLPRADPQQLNIERQGLKGDPVRLAVVLEELCRQLEQGQDKENLANFRVELGGVYMQQKPPQPEKAIARFRLALDHFLQTNAPEAVTTPLIQQLIDAYLKSANYAQAADFAEQMIARAPAQRDVMGPAIKNEADRLRSSGDPRGALQLVTEALKMNPALDPRHQDDLREIRRQIGEGQ